MKRSTRKKVMAGMATVAVSTPLVIGYGIKPEEFADFWSRKIGSSSLNTAELTLILLAGIILAGFGISKALSKLRTQPFSSSEEFGEGIQSVINAHVFRGRSSALEASMERLAQALISERPQLDGPFVANTTCGFWSAGNPTSENISVQDAWSLFVAQYNNQDGQQREIYGATILENLQSAYAEHRISQSIYNVFHSVLTNSSSLSPFRSLDAIYPTTTFRPSASNS